MRCVTKYEPGGLPAPLLWVWAVHLGSVEVADFRDVVSSKRTDVPSLSAVVAVCSICSSVPSEVATHVERGLGPQRLQNVETELLGLEVWGWSGTDLLHHGLVEHGTGHLV